MNEVSKISGVKSYKDRHKATLMDTFNSDKDVYFNARKIPIKKFPVNKIDAMDSKFIIDSKYLSKPESKVSHVKLWDFFCNSKKIRFFTSLQDSSNLISCTFESGFISVFINCEQNYKGSNSRSCVDSSIIKINHEVYRIINPELDTLIDHLRLFFKNYREYLNNNKNTPFKFDSIEEISLFSKVIVKFLSFINIPSFEKFLINSEKINYLNDDLFESLNIQNKSIEIQSIYP